jgi:GTP-binding protein HflX
LRVVGLCEGLKPSQIQELETLWDAHENDQEMLSQSLASKLANISRAIRRQVGVLIGRKGKIEQVFVGDAQRIFLPDMGRVRAGGQHFRGLRHIHTVLKDEGIVLDDLADLSQLRLDAVITISVTASGSIQRLHWAYLQPNPQREQETIVEVAADTSALPKPFSNWIHQLERHFAQYMNLQKNVQKQPRAMIVGLYPNKEESSWRLDELTELCESAGLTVCRTLLQHRRQPDARFVVGKGKLTEAVAVAVDAGVEVLVMDCSLTPTQARAIAAFAELKVIDRTQLILDIFAQHARSRDGALQVELAQLKYMLPRLTDLDTGLSRLTGGIGGRGPGETKLEINRRRARDRISKLTATIEALSAQRQLRRSKRQSSGLPMVSIVGYTNAGKSTLLHRLSGGKGDTGNHKMFATLDPATRKINLSRNIQATFTDTVGFIRDLPPDLITAFRATLEELADADVLLHIVDISSPMVEDKIRTVQQVLADLHLSTIPQLLVLNKCDLAEKWVVSAWLQREHAVGISAQTGTGIEELKSALCALLDGGHSNSRLPQSVSSNSPKDPTSSIEEFSWVLPTETAYGL